MSNLTPAPPPETPIPSNPATATVHANGLRSSITVREAVAWALFLSVTCTAGTLFLAGNISGDFLDGFGDGGCSPETTALLNAPPAKVDLSDWRALRASPAPSSNSMERLAPVEAPARTTTASGGHS